MANFTPALAQAELVKLLDLDLDSFHGTTTSDQQYMAALHEASRRVYRWAEYYYRTIAWSPSAGEQGFVAKDSATPSGSKFGAQIDVLEVLRYNGRPLCFIPWVRFDDPLYGPAWRSNTSGEPVSYSVSPDLIVTLDKPLSAGAVSTGGFSASGKGHPNIVDASSGTVYSTNEWAVHPDLQWPTLYEAAVFLGTPFASNPVSVSRLQEYHQLALEGSNEYRDASQDRLSVPDEGTAYRLGGRFIF